MFSMVLDIVHLLSLLNMGCVHMVSTSDFLIQFVHANIFASTYFSITKIFKNEKIISNYFIINFYVFMH